MKRRLLRTLVLALLLGLTAWNLTRSAKLDAATAAYRSRRYVPALQAATEHLRLRPWSREANRIAALCLSQLDFSERAEPFYRKAGPITLADHRVRAFGIVRSNRREDAIRAYRTILERWPDDADSLRNLATVHMSQWQNREAVEFAERLAALPGQEVVGSTMLGSLYHRLGETERSVSSFDRVLRLDPGLERMPLPGWQFDLLYAEGLINVGRNQEAADRLEKAVAAEPGNLILLDRLGMAYENLGRLEDAEATWLRELATDPSTPEPMIHLGKLELVRVRPERAAEYLRRAVELRPDDYAALYNLLLATRRLGLLDEARSLQARLDEAKARQGTPTKRMGPSTPTLEDAHD